MRAQGGSTPGAGPGHTPPPGWHVLARAPRHAAAQSGRQMLQNQQEAQEMLGGSALSHCPEGLRRPMTRGAGTNLGRGTAPSAPVPAIPLPWDPLFCLWVCCPALPAPPNQSLSKGWSSQIFCRASSVYHAVNLGFQQLHEAAGRWERTKRCSAPSDTACVCQDCQGLGPQPRCKGSED